MDNSWGGVSCSSKKQPTTSLHVGSKPHPRNRKLPRPHGKRWLGTNLGSCRGRWGTPRTGWRARLGRLPGSAPPGCRAKSVPPRPPTEPTSAPAGIKRWLGQRGHGEQPDDKLRMRGELRRMLCCLDSLGVLVRPAFCWAPRDPEDGRGIPNRAAKILFNLPDGKTWINRLMQLASRRSDQRMRRY